MPSVSKNQKQIMSMAYALKKGKINEKDFPNESMFEKVKQIADNMSDKDLKDYMDTKSDKLPDKVNESLTLKDFILNVIKEEYNILLNENISIKNNLDSIEILFLNQKIKNKDKIKDITNLLKKYVKIDKVDKNNNSIKFSFNDSNDLSTTNFISFVTEIKNKLGLNIKRENKNTYIIGLE